MTMIASYFRDVPLNVIAVPLKVLTVTTYI